jgi:hypothetical protein
MAREFEIRREVELEATPEEVWEALTTADGTAAWLFPYDNEPGEDGMTASGSKITAWDPPRHFAARTEGEDGWFNALESVIEARAGATTVLRYVHSGIFVEDWDNQYDSADQHTDFYLQTLGEYLRHFAGRTATYIGGGPSGIEGPEASKAPDGLDAVRRALGLGDRAAVGDGVRLAPEGLEPADGVVSYAHPRFLGIRTGDALVCFFGRNAWGMPVGMSAHLFTDGVDVAATERAWKGWLDGVFAAKAA